MVGAPQTAGKEEGEVLPQPLRMEKGGKVEGGVRERSLREAELGGEGRGDGGGFRTISE